MIGIGIAATLEWEAVLKYYNISESKIKEISLNSPIGRSIYLKNINDNIYYYVNNKKINKKC